MKEMSENEYKAHLEDSFDSKYFRGQDGFVFSITALKEGLTAIEHDLLWMENSLDDDNVEYLAANELKHMLRKTQVIANILKSCLDGVKIQIAK